MANPSDDEIKKLIGDTPISGAKPLGQEYDLCTIGKAGKIAAEVAAAVGKHLYDEMGHKVAENISALESNLFTKLHEVMGEADSQMMRVLLARDQALALSFQAKLDATIAQLRADIRANGTAV